MTRRSEIGQLGENIAARYLKKKRYKIFDRNFREKWGEIDIIAVSPEKELVFIEVKTVSGLSPSITAENQLTKSKLSKLQKTAELYANSQDEKLIRNGWRIDLLAINIDGEKAIIKHYENI